MENILKKINNNRISAENIYELLENRRWDFQKQEEYLLTNLKIDFENPVFWYVLGLIFYNNYKKDKSRKIFIENALFCFNKPFEKNKNKGKTIVCDSFQDPNDLFALEFSEYDDFLNESLDYLMVVYRNPVFYEGFSLPNIKPTKPEIIERFEVIIKADYNDLLEKKEKTLIDKIKDNEFKVKVLNFLKRNKKIELDEIAKRLNFDITFVNDLLGNLVIEKKIEGKIQKNLITITKMLDFNEYSIISLSDKGQCTICQQKIEEKSIKCSYCSSKFHLKCLINWLETNKTCPYCQKNLEY